MEPKAEEEATLLAGDLDVGWVAAEVEPGARQVEEDATPVEDV